MGEGSKEEQEMHENGWTETSVVFKVRGKNTCLN